MSEPELWNEIHRLGDEVREVRASVGGMTDRLAGFDLALLLLSAATDAAACKTRLAELREEMTATEKAQAALTAEREAHSRRGSDECAGDQASSAGGRCRRRRTPARRARGTLRRRTARTIPSEPELLRLD
jgi:hypothetical protein